MNFPNRDSAYVGLVEETGSLFAMTPRLFPLVVFADDVHDVCPELIDGPQSLTCPPIGMELQQQILQRVPGNRGVCAGMDHQIRDA